MSPQLIDPHEHSFAEWKDTCWLPRLRSHAAKSNSAGGVRLEAVATKSKADVSQAGNSYSTTDSRRPSVVQRAAKLGLGLVQDTVAKVEGSGRVGHPKTKINGSVLKPPVSNLGCLGACTAASAEMKANAATNGRHMKAEATRANGYMMLDEQKSAADHSGCASSPTSSPFSYPVGLAPRAASPTPTWPSPSHTPLSGSSPASKSTSSNSPSKTGPSRNSPTRTSPSSNSPPGSRANRRPRPDSKVLARSV
uniref:Uncharacterized protein n=1 Tax=Haptolina brevifila TaxID=156173 RepID=A0A7S2BJB0_9EUKA|mmetsp:Transcript_13126/g.26392  ORF Transcript_13126/g.26392 Transcript_13126/m.26392 type:complete len:251 (+) Transcript_13126:62-814(+)